MAFATPENLTRGYELITYADQYTGYLLGIFIPFTIFVIVFAVSSYTLKPLQAFMTASFITWVLAILFNSIGVGNDILVAALGIGLMISLAASVWKRQES